MTGIVAQVSSSARPLHFISSSYLGPFSTYMSGIQPLGASIIHGILCIYRLIYTLYILLVCSSVVWTLVFFWYVRAVPEAKVVQNKDVYLNIN